MPENQNRRHPCLEANENHIQNLAQCLMVSLKQFIGGHLPKSTASSTENEIRQLQRTIYFFVVAAGAVGSFLLSLHFQFIVRNYFVFGLATVSLICFLFFLFLPRYLSISKLSQLLVLIVLAIIILACVRNGGLGPGNLMLFVSIFSLILILLPRRLAIYNSALVWFCFFGVMIYELRHPEVRGELTTYEAILNSNISVVVILAITFLGISIIANSYFKVRVENSSMIEKLQLQNKIIESDFAFKKKLLAAISHDIRSPLQDLVSVSELFKANVLSENDIEAFIPNLTNKLQSASNSVNEILSWSSSDLEEDNPTKDQIQMKPLVKELEEELSQRLRAKNITLNLKISNIEFEAKKNWVKSILRNLLTNAIKFSHAGGSIEIKSEISEAFVVTSVTDNGVGMSSEVLKGLFSDRLYSSKGTGGEKGAGLGLKLTKDFVEKLGGRLWVDSQLGKGTTFTCAIPFGS